MFPQHLQLTDEVRKAPRCVLETPLGCSDPHCQGGLQNICLFIYLFVCGGGACTGPNPVEVKRVGHFSKDSFLLPPWGSWGLNSGHLIWQRLPLPTGPGYSNTQLCSLIGIYSLQSFGDFPSGYSDRISRSADDPPR